MDPTVAAAVRRWLKQQGIDENALRNRHRLPRTTKPLRRPKR